PVSPDEIAAQVAALVDHFRLQTASAQAVWNLFGMESSAVIGKVVSEAAEDQSSGSVATDRSLHRRLTGTELPVPIVDWIIRHEQVRTVADLVERRLLLVFAPRVDRETLDQLERRIVAVHGSCPAGATAAVESLQRNYGRVVEETPHANIPDAPRQT
ncbi:MAG: hypothetical protein KDA75_22695, partial [Planctomycetaceae bacterium]|nr:hypothetical protein [Planctomycetaceae bacterium]